tara:strand:- start:706 stop:1077 length:372 start_codon:yes stop_codon:yes gene_type:complete
MAKKMNKLWLIPLLLLIPSAARANQVSPQFTQGSMQATTITTQVITEVVDQEIFGGTYNSWSGTNVIPSGNIVDPQTSYTVHTAGEQFQIETVTRPAGVVEQIDIDRSITTNSTTTSLSVFSQ